MDHLLEDPHYCQAAKNLARVVRFLASRGWTPATSSNFSVRLNHWENRFAISRSGTDKHAFSAEDVMVIDSAGDAVAPIGARPSAETLLHTLMYQDPKIGAVLHTHSVSGTVLSLQHQSLVLQGFELLKGIRGIHSHDVEVVLPVFANDQDMQRLSSEVARYQEKHPEMVGYLIAGHGLYTWGADLAEAQRHVESFEFLFECVLKMQGR